MRQWQNDHALPMDGSALHRGFETAGILGTLPDFSIAMDALLFGARRALRLHPPACPQVSGDEATLVALCGLAQSGHEGPLRASLAHLIAPAATRVAAERLEVFAMALAQAGLTLSPPAGAAGARIN